VELNTIAGSNKTNAQAKQFPVKKLKKVLGDLKGKRIALLGLAFKANTDDMREASSVEIAEELKKAGAIISAYDPIAQENAKKAMPYIEYCDTPYKALIGADAMILVTEWPEFTSLDYRRIKKQMNRPLIIDARNFLDKKALTQAGFEYEGIGV